MDDESRLQEAWVRYLATTPRQPFLDLSLPIITFTEFMATHCDHDVSDVPVANPPSWLLIDTAKSRGRA